MSTIILDPVLEPESVQIDAMRRGLALDGTKDGVNTTFTAPNGEKFYHTSNLTISVFLNGQRLALGVNYTVSESGGAGTGYDTVTFLTAPPDANDELIADYVRKTV